MSSAWPLRSRRAGTASMVGCARSCCRRRQGVTSASPSVKRSRFLSRKGHGVRQIARTIGRDPGTISRELRRNAATRGRTRDYRASVAQWKADMAARRPKEAKLVANPRLREYVGQRLSGHIVDEDGNVVAGPPVEKWTGRNKPRRKDRAWVRAWGPEQISRRLPLDLPDDESMRISHEAIYQSLYIQGRGALRRELILSCAPGVRCAPRGRARSARRGRTSRPKRSSVNGLLKPTTVQCRAIGRAT